MRTRASLRMALGVSVLLASAPVANRGAGLLAPRPPDAAPEGVSSSRDTGAAPLPAAPSRAAGPEPRRESSGGAPAWDPTALDPERRLVSTSRETFVRAEPDPRSTKLGYLRAGAKVTRSTEPVGRRGCAGGWYRVAPEGYVCVGKTASLDLGHPMAVTAERRPDRRSALPYEYGEPRGVPPLLYDHVPSGGELRRGEAGAARRRSAAGAWHGLPSSSVPEFLRDGRPAPTLFGYARSSPGEPQRAPYRSGFAFLSLFETDAGAFGLTTEMNVVSLARVERVAPSDFAGIALDDAGLPVVFVKVRGASLYAGDPVTQGLTPERGLAYREAVPITGRRVTAGGASYLETRTGGWLLDRNLVRVDAVRPPRGFDRPGRTWLDVSIVQQTLVVYDGIRPVFATLVSTGAGGLGDPEETRATIRGQFRIHTKHVTATMSGDEVGGEFALSDVPYVQYFSEGYALHAAYWHDAFGTPKSHGCINLSPSDARFLFHFTDPPVPMAWHGAFSLRRGTLISIHP